MDSVFDNIALIILIAYFCWYLLQLVYQQSKKAVLFKNNKKTKQKPLSKTSSQNEVSISKNMALLLMTKKAAKEKTTKDMLVIGKIMITMLATLAIASMVPLQILLFLLAVAIITTAKLEGIDPIFLLLPLFLLLPMWAIAMLTTAKIMADFFIEKLFIVSNNTTNSFSR